MKDKRQQISESSREISESLQITLREKKKDGIFSFAAAGLESPLIVKYIPLGTFFPPLKIVFDIFDVWKQNPEVVFCRNINEILSL